MPEIEAKFLTPTDTLIIDGEEFPIFEIDRSAVWAPTNSDRIAVFLEACTDIATLFKPWEWVTIK